ncbi:MULTISPECIES: GNAT family N-acetyltransferase [unclassified Microbacterium]|uniref:GNAT family N-acetyltransferase n=1 Tax=unclassified Microbacterium TaxID=2609290 RepID=UPI00214C76EE|nr:MULTISPECIES: GNAT family N-acetyltransferase [unclassified Microbacterium]MCR2783312.1 GNAT family N-acetyltransferase [Microbacterium sp. zg.B96]WIM15814.1 GNAT family N-acetyltransferase [Microbacterium sp. zg-B96]
MADLDDLSAPPGIEIRPLETVDEVFAASDVLAEVWGGDYSGMPAGLLRALAHSGNYAVGLYDADRIIGASVAFFAAPAERSMHSHVTGVLAEYRGHRLGRLLKQHQRQWAFARDVGHITWTFDPLIARNAHFNLVVLGARVTEYLPNQYGPMDDVINRGDESDRLMVSWALAGPAATTDPGDVVATVAVPPDIETMRQESPDEAMLWRRRVREQFAAHAASGLVVGGFDDARGYLFVPA